MGEMQELRRATAEDEAAIRNLTRAAYAKWVPGLGREPLPMMADYAAALRAHRFDLLFVAGELSGLIETVFAPDHLFVENVAVRPEAQGRGLGRRLMSEAERLAAEAGLTVVKLQTNKLFAANLRFYGSLGYSIDGEHPFRGGTVVHLSKKIAS